MRPKIRPVIERDVEGVRNIYNYYVNHSTATFEEAPVETEEMCLRIGNVMSAGKPWLVAEVQGAIEGYAYAMPWRPRTAYRYCVEVTVYVRQDTAGSGIGSRLYESLLSQLTTEGIRSFIGVLVLPNDRSVALHEKFGFEKVAHLHQVGYKFEQWLDVGYWQKLVE